MTLGRSMPSPSLLHYLLYHHYYSIRPSNTTLLAPPSRHHWPLHHYNSCLSITLPPFPSLPYSPHNHYITCPCTTLLAYSPLHTPLQHYTARPSTTEPPTASSLVLCSPVPPSLKYLPLHHYITCPFLTTPLAHLWHCTIRPSITTLLAPPSLLYPPFHHYATRSYITAKPAPSSLYYPPLRHHHPLLFYPWPVKPLAYSHRPSWREVVSTKSMKYVIRKSTYLIDELVDIFWRFF